MMIASATFKNELDWSTLGSLMAQTSAGTENSWNHKKKASNSRILGWTNVKMDRIQAFNTAFSILGFSC
jgi:hypothetical protein